MCPSFQLLPKRIMSNAVRSVVVERGPVSLGCGTLILIALIVLFFSNRGEDGTPQVINKMQRLESQIGTLQSTIEHLARSIDQQTAKIEQLEQEISRRDKPGDSAPQPQPSAKE